MWEEILLLNGVIGDKDGKKVDQDKLFQLLEANGFTYEGGVGLIRYKEMMEAERKIEAYITPEKVCMVRTLLTNHYGEMPKEEMESFFTSNFGTGIFDSIFEQVLDTEMYALYRKYTNTTWQVADEFGSDLGEMMVRKLAQG